MWSLEDRDGIDDPEMSGIEGKSTIESMLTVWASAIDEAFDPKVVGVELGGCI